MSVVYPKHHRHSFW